jgi:hypothetical protein
MAEQAAATAERRASPVVVISSRKGISQYILATRGKLEDGSEGTVHDPIRLMPGANRIEADRWKAFAKEVKPDLERGTLRVMNKALSGYEEQDAVQIVKSTIDRSLLNAFRSVDSRKDVRKAIDRQLKDIAGKATENEDAELDN